MKTDDAETIEYKGYTIHIQWDSDPMNPCEEFDMMGKMCFFHNRYNLGHKHELGHFTWGEKYYPDNPEGLQEFVNRNDVLALPVFMYEHSGITIKTSSFHDYFDSGQIGYIYATYETLRKEYNTKRITKTILERATGLLQAEISEYDDYLTGNVYGYVVTDENDEHVDSCWGFYGDEGKKEAINQGKGYIDWQEKEEAQRVYLSQPYLTGMEA